MPKYIFRGDVSVKGHLALDSAPEGPISITKSYPETALEVDWSGGGSYQIVDFGSALEDIGITFSNPLPREDCYIKIVQGPNATQPIFGEDVVWQDSAAPTISTDEDSVTLISFVYNGSKYFGSHVGVFAVWRSEQLVATAHGPATVSFYVGTTDSFEVNWGDGTSDSYALGFRSVSHTYDNSGDYYISIGAPDLSIVNTLYMEGNKGVLTAELTDWAMFTGLERIVSYTADLYGDLNHISGLVNLKQLILENSSISGDLNNLASLTNMIRVNFESVPNVYGDIVAFSGMTQLENIYMFGTGLISGTTGSLSSLNSLTNLMITDCSQITGNVSELNLLTSLEYLRIKGTGISGDFSGIPGLTNLIELDISLNMSGDIGNIANYPNLQSFFSYSPLVEGNISTIFSTPFPNLALFWVNDAPNVVGDIGIFTSHSLGSINLRGTGVGGNIASLKDMLSIPEIYLCNTAVEYLHLGPLQWTGNISLAANSSGLNTSQQVDDFLIDINDCGGVTWVGLEIAGTNATRTSASNTAVTNMRDKGYWISVNE